MKEEIPNELTGDDLNAQERFLELLSKPKGDGVEAQTRFLECMIKITYFKVKSSMIHSHDRIKLVKFS